MDVLKVMRQHLFGRNMAYKARVAKAMGLPFRTLYDLAKGYKSNPTYRTSEKMRKYYEARGEEARQKKMLDQLDGRLKK